VAPQFVAGGIFVLPVLAVILVAFAGGLTGRARQVVQAAVAIQAVALALGVLSWLGALGGHMRQGKASGSSSTPRISLPWRPR
jgi:hypothetical protein